MMEPFLSSGKKAAVAAPPPSAVSSASSPTEPTPGSEPAHPAAASASSAPPSGSAELLPPAEDAIEWVACDTCNKWRRIPADAMPAEDAEWHCAMGPLSTSCDEPEDAWDELEWSEEKGWEENEPCADLIAPGWHKVVRRVKRQGERVVTAEERHELLGCISRFKRERKTQSVGLTSGWIVQSKQRPNGGSRSIDYTYTSPEGEKFNSDVKLQRYFDQQCGTQVHYESPAGKRFPTIEQAREYAEEAARQEAHCKANQAARNVQRTAEARASQAEPRNEQQPIKRDEEEEEEEEEVEVEEEEEEDEDSDEMVIDGVSSADDRAAEEAATAEEAALDALGGVPKTIDIYWPDDFQFYTAKVLSYSAATGKHQVQYYVDGEHLEEDLGREKWYRHLEENSPEASEILARVTEEVDRQLMGVQRGQRKGEEASSSAAEPGPGAATEAGATEAGATEAATTEAAPSEPAPTEAAPPEPAPTEAAPSEPEPTEAAPSEVVAAPQRRAASAASQRLRQQAGAPSQQQQKQKSTGRCGTCDGCANYAAGTSTECGECKFCLNMPKRGGKGRIMCELRLCERDSKSRKRRLEAEVSKARCQAFRQLECDVMIKLRDQWEKDANDRQEAERAARAERMARRATLRAAKRAAKRAAAAAAAAAAAQQQQQRKRKRPDGGGGEGKRHGKAAVAPEAGAPAALPRRPPPRVAEAVLESNGQPGHKERFLVRWAKPPKPFNRPEASWEPARKVPPALLIASLEEARAAFNRKALPELASAEGAVDGGAVDGGAEGGAGGDVEGGAGAALSGVVALSVPPDAAAECSAYLLEHWRDGRLPLRDGTTACFGYATYGKTLSAHDASQQAAHTLLMTNPLLPLLRLELPGFHAIELFLIGWLHENHGVVVELYFAHGLRQSPETLKSTGFDVHQDTEDFPYAHAARSSPAAAPRPAPPHAPPCSAPRPTTRPANVRGRARCWRARL